jgi:MFS family permease
MSPTEPSLRSYAASSFLPAMIYEIGNGAVAPVLVTTATALHASTGIAAFSVSLLGIGRVLGDVPAAWIADRFGDRRSMIGAAVLAFVCFFVCIIAPSLLILDINLIVLGMTSATFYIARQAYLLDVVPLPMRARAQSTLAGAHRIGLFIGPFLGAAAISVSDVRGAYVVAMASAAAAALVLFLVPDAEVNGVQDIKTRATGNPVRALRTHLRLFLTLGFAVAAVGAIRQARQIVLPLWAQHIGLSPAQTSIVFGIASAVDMVLFYPSGKVMDRWGRLAIAIPSMVVMAIGMFLLVLTHGIVALTIVAMLMSFGNGIGSGIMQTIGADAAPDEGRRPFLGIWRLYGDTGQAVGPLIVSVVAGVATLALGIVSVGFIGLLAAAGLALWVPKFSSFGTPRAVRLNQQHLSRPAPPEGGQAGPPTEGRAAQPEGEPAAQPDSEIAALMLEELDE